MIFEMYEVEDIERDSRIIDGLISNDSISELDYIFATAVIHAFRSSLSKIGYFANSGLLDKEVWQELHYLENLNIENMKSTHDFSVVLDFEFKVNEVFRMLEEIDLDANDLKMLKAVEDTVGKIIIFEKKHFE